MWPFHSYRHIAHSKVDHGLATLIHILNVAVDLARQILAALLLAHVPRDGPVLRVLVAHDHLTATFRCNCLLEEWAFAVLSFGGRGVLSLVESGM